MGPRSPGVTVPRLPRSCGKGTERMPLGISVGGQRLHTHPLCFPAVLSSEPSRCGFWDGLRNKSEGHLLCFWWKAVGMSSAAAAETTARLRGCDRDTKASSVCICQTQLLQGHAPLQLQRLPSSFFFFLGLEEAFAFLTSHTNLCPSPCPCAWP